MEDGAAECSFFKSQGAVDGLLLMEVCVCVYVYLECVCLADGLECGPGVRPADLQRRLVGEDVVAELLQRRLWIRRGKLSRLLHLLTDRHVDFLTGQK